ncbi:hypothetical protein [Rhodanobacter sp. BL-MT-08]
MANAEQAITVTARLYELRKTTRSLLGDRYDSEIAEFSEALQTIVAKRHVTLLDAAMSMGKAAQEIGADIAFMKVMSAYVEITEAATEHAHG